MGIAGNDRGMGAEAKAEDLRFLEIEHKFLVPPAYDPEVLFAMLRTERVQKHYRTEVQDTYYLVAHPSHVVYRHRLDASLQQLTLKSLAGDNETRTEINLDLNLAPGDQGQAITAFLAKQGLLWSGTLFKSLEVFYFDDAEVCFYRARFDGDHVACIEIEARGHTSIGSAQAALARWEKRLGLDPHQRCRSSLLELLLLPHLPDELRGRLQNLLSSS